MITEIFRKNIPEFNKPLRILLNSGEASKDKKSSLRINFDGGSNRLMDGMTMWVWRVEFRTGIGGGTEVSLVSRMHRHQQKHDSILALTEFEYKMVLKLKETYEKNNPEKNNQ